MNAATSLPRNVSPSPMPEHQRRIAPRRRRRRPAASASTQHQRERAGQPPADRAHGVGERTAVALEHARRRGARRSRCRSRWRTRRRRASSSARSSAKFSMIPLCTTAMRPLASVCGCALRSFGAPCVAHRVCPMPVVPVIVRDAISLSRFSIRPAFLAICSSPCVGDDRDARRSRSRGTRGGAGPRRRRRDTAADRRTRRFRTCRQGTGAAAVTGVRGRARAARCRSSVLGDVVGGSDGDGAVGRLVVTG